MLPNGRPRGRSSVDWRLARIVVTTAKISVVRIGTWNLEGKWSSDHLALLAGENCDAWLLTEVRTDTSIPGMRAHATAELMGPRKTWAAVFSNADDVAPQPDPHRATAMVDVDGCRLMSSVLPWRSCGSSWPGSSLADKLEATLKQLRAYVDQTTIWGGDWNQSLEGREYVGSLEGRNQIIDLVDVTGLSVPTRSLGSARPGQRSIDHVAIPLGWDVNGAYRISAEVNGRRLSDHDAFVVSVGR